MFWRTTFTSMPPVHWLTMECVTFSTPLVGVGLGVGVGEGLGVELGFGVGETVLEGWVERF